MTNGTSPLGAQIKRLRRDADLTQEQLAERAGVSVDLIAKLEQGRRQSALVPSLVKLANALDVDLSELIGKRARLDRDEDVRVLAVRDVILTPSILPGIEPDDGEPPALDVLDRAVAGLWADYWAGRLSRLTATVPGVIGEARMASRAYGAAAARPLAQSYQAAACLAVHLGRDDWAVIAAERAVHAATTGDDELLWATVNGTYAWCVHHQGRLDVAERHALRVAEQIEPNFTRAPLPHLTVWGGLVLTGLASAAAAGRADECAEYIGLARVGAGRLDHDRHDYEVNFGPTQVAMQATHAYTMLRKPDRALRSAKNVDRADLQTISYGRHLLDKAQAHTYAGHLRAAETTLVEAENMSPEWFRHQGPARSLVGELVEETTRLSPTLRRLAKSVDVDR